LEKGETMKYIHIVHSAILATLFLGPPTNPPKGSVSGKVMIRGYKKGLAGAPVKLHLSSGNDTEWQATLSDGTYRFENVPPGLCTVVVKAPGYLKRPDDSTKVAVQGAVTAVDVVLVAEHGSAQYYAIVADTIAALVHSLPREQQTSAWKKEWDNLGTINLPTDAKCLVARSLIKLDDAADTAIPDLNQYADADMNKLKAIQAKFKKAVDNPDTLPTKSSLQKSNLTSVLVADVVIYRLNSTDESVSKRKVFANNFLTTWDGGPTVERVQTYVKEKNRPR
jgi:hypothetical protein